MIVIEHFSELVNIKDVELAGFISSLYLKVKGDMEEVEGFKGDFEYWFGGPVFIVEDMCDLNQITTMIDDGSGRRWTSILENSDSFDVCEYVMDGRYVQIVNITTDAGGNTYMVPRNIADQVPYIAESIEKTELLWGGNKNKQP